MQQKKTVIIIAGPTASGKTALAIQLAEKLRTSIISADSRQCFRELNIGVAKPTEEELRRVKHYFVNSHSITENVTAKTFEQYALHAVDEIFETSDFAIIAGGTGLYIKAFCEGLDEMPDIDPAVRSAINDNYQKFGLEWLQMELQQKDPGFWKISEQQNPRRLMRALEVLYSTGKSMSVFRQTEKTERPFNIIQFGIDLPKPDLHRNIANRVDVMVEQGLIGEVQSLLPFKHLNALQTVGYRELLDYFEGGLSLESAIEKIKQNTRQYAKRQLTWFRKDKSIKWGAPESLFSEIIFFLINTGFL